MQWITWHSSSESSMFVLKNRVLWGHVTQSAGKKSLHSLWSVEGIPNAPYPSPKYLFIFRVDTSLFLFNFTFENLILHISLLIIIIIRCSGMFQNVPCSWFYRRPFQIDVLFHVSYNPELNVKNYVNLSQVDVKFIHTISSYGNCAFFQY